jgi:hypothetical protein
LGVMEAHLGAMEAYPRATVKRLTLEPWRLILEIGDKVTEPGIIKLTIEP